MMAANRDVSGVSDHSSDGDYIPESAISDASENYSATEDNEFSATRKTRKRVRHPEKWKKSIAKRNRNSGKAYVATSGMFMSAKEFEDHDCKCKKKCFSKFSAASRKKLFTHFWKMGQLSLQNTYICGLVKRAKIQRRRPSGTRPLKTCSYVYTLPNNNATVIVCQKYFEHTFQVSHGRLMRTLTAFQENNSPRLDGRKANPNHKLPDALVKSAIAHISKFPAYESHYSRVDNPERKYLHPDLTIRKMYQMFVEECRNADVAAPVVKESYYRFIFNTKFNLHFHVPRSDTCKQCDLFAMKQSSENDNEAITELKQNHELHLRKAEASRKSLKNDTELSKEGNVYAFTFDLEKALPLPKLSVSVAYYKRNMYVYNVGIHELHSGSVYMYVWDETVASRGAQEIASCLTKHLRTFASDKKHVIMYSDCCGGQNRNIKVAATLMKAVTEKDSALETIDHKFLVPGHSFLPNDRDFGIVELAAKKREHIYNPDEWYDVIRTARKKQPFKVIVMERTDFLSTASLEDAITNRKLTVDKQPVAWMKMQWIRYERSQPKKLQFKMTVQEEMDFSTVCFEKNTRGRPHSLARVNQASLYARSRPVTIAKKQDMIDLLPFIPPVKHAYFNNLLTAEGSDLEEGNNQ